MSVHSGDMNESQRQYVCKMIRRQQQEPSDFWTEDHLSQRNFEGMTKPEIYGTNELQFSIKVR
jgi:hypothetical protein